MRSGAKEMVMRVGVLLGMSVTLFAGGIANSGPVMAHPTATTENEPVAANPLAETTPLATPACVDAGPPSSGFFRDARYSQPNACRKCQAAGAAYEITGKYDAHCQNILNQAGTVTAVQLWLRCVACRSTATLSRGLDPEVVAEIQRGNR